MREKNKKKVWDGTMPFLFLMAIKITSYINS